MNFYAHHIGDYRAATQHLTWEQHAAYRAMMDLYYLTERPLPLDRKRIYVLTLCQTPKHRQAVDSVLVEFFIETTEGYRHKRCDAEIAKASDKREKAKDSAAKRWQGSNASESNANAYANASPNAHAIAMPPHIKGNAPNPNPNPNPNKEEEERIGARATFDMIEKALATIPELDGHPVKTDLIIAPIVQMVDKGYDLTGQIIPSIRRQAAAAKMPLKRWAYFVDGITQDAAEITPANGAHAHERPRTQRRQTPGEAMREALDDLQQRAAGRHQP